MIELFKNLEEPDLLFLSNPQNYIPIYNKFFALNDTNFNFVNLNHKWYIANEKTNKTKLYSHIPIIYPNSFLSLFSIGLKENTDNF